MRFERAALGKREVGSATPSAAVSKLADLPVCPVPLRKIF
jgi:hypothetical protein